MALSLMTGLSPKMKFEKVHLGYDALHALYKNLGTRGKRVHNFESMMINKSSKKWVVENKIKSVREVASKVGFDIPKYLSDKTVST